MALLDTMTAEEAIANLKAYVDRQQPKAYPLDVSRWQLSLWAKWVAVIDNSGEVWEYEDEPHIAVAMWHWGNGSRAQCIGTIDMTGVDWRQTLTPVNQEQQAQNERHNITLRNIEAARGILSGLTGGEPSEVVQRRLRGYEDDAQPWCERCNLPEDICRGHDDPITQPSATVEVIVRRWQQLNADELGVLARKLAQVDAMRADMFAEALWGEALDAERARLLADDAVMEESNWRAVDAAPDEWDAMPAMAGSVT